MAERTKHQVGDLVYYRGTLGYIMKIDGTFGKSEISHYTVYWFSKNVEDDTSGEWDDTMDGLKRNLQEYLMLNHR